MSGLRVWRWKLHWQIALAIALGIGAGALLQLLDADPRLAAAFGPDGTAVDVGTDLREAGLRSGDRVVAINQRPLEEGERVAEVVGDEGLGAVALRVRRGERELTVPAEAEMAPGSPRARALAPFDLLAEAFLRLLQMLIVPLIITSLVSGVTGLESSALGRMGLKTLLYYVLTSVLAVSAGLLVVNVIGPGRSAALPLEEDLSPGELTGDASLTGVFLRMIPENVFGALGDNSSILQVIFFSVLFAVFVTRTGGESGELLARLFRSGFEVVMKVAEFVLLFVPIGVFALIARVVGTSGISQFAPLLVFMATVVLGLLLHACVTLPLLLLFLGRVRPHEWVRAVLPALMTAFSTSSSSITLPETLRSVEERGRVSNRTGSFVLPLGATINMDGTALYECVGVVFLAQHYAASAGFELTLGKQLIVVVTAFLASVGAAGIPSAGLVMMTTILTALELPLEGVFLLLAVDRPLDMLRTSVNVWSDTTCAAIVARSEGECDITGSVPL